MRPATKDEGLFSYPTPFTPPTTEDDRLSWLRLIRSRKVGVATFWRLIEDHGSAQAALLTLPEMARASGIDGYEVFSEAAAQAELRAGQKAGARLLCRGEPDYPADLAQLPDAPPLLWARGDLAVLRRPLVAIVGARNASSLGTRTARKLAADLAQAGATVVSGLARGIDAAAHAAALPGATVAVMAGGVDQVYPVENAALAAKIAETGLLLTEQPVGLQPVARHFPQRNRLISGLSRTVVVVEAAAQSGSLITARIALDQGREVCAVPGHPFDGRASGCNALIRDGATLVRGAADVLAVLGDVALAQPVAAPIEPEPAEPASTPGWRAQANLHQVILDRLGPSPVAEDQLLRDLALSPAEVAQDLLDLELAGRVVRSAGGLLARA